MLMLRKDVPLGKQFRYLKTAGDCGKWLYTAVEQLPTTGYVNSYEDKTAYSTQSTAGLLWDNPVQLVETAAEIEERQIMTTGMSMVQLEHLIRTEGLALPNESIIACCLRIITELLEQPQKFLVWNPDSDKPPGKIMSKKQAYKVAEKMADEHGGKFYIAQLLDVVEFEEKEVEQVIKVKERTKKVSKP